jgi:hypothetical protein
MTKKTILTVFACIALFLFSANVDLYADGNYLNVGLHTQEHSQWCWDASCQCIFAYIGYNYSQCAIANYAFSRSDCCGNTTFNWYHSCNQPNTLPVMVNVLGAGGVSAYSTGALSWSTIQSCVNNSKPFIIGRSGHATVGYGYWTEGSTNYIGHMDPWPGEGYKWEVYNYFISGWFGSARLY